MHTKKATSYNKMIILNKNRKNYSWLWQFVRPGNVLSWRDLMNKYQKKYFFSMSIKLTEFILYDYTMKNIKNVIVEPERKKSI